MDMSRLLFYITIPFTAVNTVNTPTAWVFVCLCVCVYRGVRIDMHICVSTQQCVGIYKFIFSLHNNILMYIINIAIITLTEDY